MTGELFSLKGTTAVVTGANTGLGQAIAVGLARAGTSAVLVGRSECNETRSMIESAGGRAVTIRTDLSDTVSVKEIIAVAVGEFGSIDILVNNAGIIRRSPALEFSEKDWDEVMAVNVRTLFFLSQAAAKEMKKRGRGKIINIASLLSFQGGINVPSYAASKGAVAQVTKAMANELASTGINVNAIAPGYMSTNNTGALRADEERNRQILERIPAGRWGTPGDVIGAAVFLASRASDYIHGHVLVVDGGWMAR